MSDPRGRRERLDSLFATDNAFERAGLLLAFGLLLLWAWLAIDIGDNLPRLWRFVKFIVSLLPGGDTPMFTPELRSFMITLAIIGTVVVIVLFFRSQQSGLKAALVTMIIFSLIIIGVPLYTLSLASAANPELSQATGMLVVLIASCLTIFLLLKRGS